MAQKKTYEAEIALSVNTQKAKEQVEQFSKTLQQGLTKTNFGSKATGTLEAELQHANTVAVNLRSNLEQAFNMKTGKLDFTQFTKGMQSAGYTVKDYVNSLGRLGQEGQAAFQQLAHSVLNSEIQLKRTHPLLNRFVDSLGKVAMWQVSSRALAAFTNGIRDAYQFTQDLNESLNKIRIVTKANTDEMAAFAVTANKAAQALASTTLDYTNASLIYFQQGLSEEEVLKRTDVTVKMANVTGDAVKTVSNQLTAVWNNFDKGGEHLEYYADVMTKLGATTASSSAEIAEGLEKFAPVAETVGLSYEYAAAALATVTAETRLSADVVGTAFKTILARMESLKLGESLEDGVGLTKYTAALESIGVELFDINGEIRNMDDILDDVGAKWADMDRSQQSAFATTLAGVRQFSTFMALMNNWEEVKINVDVATNSEGELEEQAKIYEESWKGAAARVKDTLQSIYMTLLDDSAFIDIINAFNEILKVVSALIKGLGGLPGVLSAIANIVLMIKNDVVATSLGNGLQNMWLNSKAGKNYQVEQRQQIVDAYANRQKRALFESGFDADKADEEVINAPGEALKRQLALKNDLIRVGKTLSQADQERLDFELKYLEALAQEKIEVSKRKSQEELDVAAASKKLQKAYQSNENAAMPQVTQAQNTYSNLWDHLNKIESGSGTNKHRNGISEQVKGELEALKNLTNDEVFTKIKQKFEETLTIDGTKSKEKLKAVIADIKRELNSAFGGENNNRLTEEVKNKVGTKNIQAYKDASQTSKILTTASQSLGLSRGNIDWGQELGTQNFQQNIAILKQSLSTLFSDEEQMPEKAKEALDKLFEAKNSDELKNAIDQINAAIKEAEENARRAKKEMSEAGGAENAEEVTNAIDTQNQSLQENINILNKKNHTEKEGAKTSRDLRNSSKKDFQQMGQQMANTARAMMSITQIFNTIKGIMQTINDDSMSSGEKAMAVFSALASAIIPVMSTISMFTAVKQADSVASVENAASNTALAASEGAVGAAASAATGPTLGFAGALHAAMGPIGWIIAALTALVAIIIAAVDAFRKFNEEQSKNTAQYKLSVLTKAGEELDEKLRSAAESSEQLAESSKKYNSLIEKLQDLSISSNEYKENLEEILKLQAEMIKSSAGLQYLINNYGQEGLKWTDIYNSDGTLKKDFLTKASAKEEEIYNNTKIAKTVNDLELQKTSGKVVNSQGRNIQNLQSAFEALARWETGYTSTIFTSNSNFNLEDSTLYNLFGSSRSQSEQASIRSYGRQLLKEQSKKLKLNLLDEEIDAILSTYISMSVQTTIDEFGQSKAITNSERQATLTDTFYALLDAKERVESAINSTLEQYGNAESLKQLYELTTRTTDEKGLTQHLAFATYYNEQIEEAYKRIGSSTEYLEKYLRANSLLTDDGLKDANKIFSEFKLDKANGVVKYKINKDDSQVETVYLNDLIPYDEIFQAAMATAQENMTYDYLGSSKTSVIAAVNLEKLWQNNGDIRQLTLEEASSVLKSLDGLTEEIVDQYLNNLEQTLFTTSNGSTDSQTIEERANLYNLQHNIANKAGEDVSNRLLETNAKEQDTLLKMVEDGTITATNNLQLFADAMGIAIKDINGAVIDILTNLQTVGLSYVQEYNKHLSEYNEIIGKALNEDSITKDELNMLKRILPNANDYFKVDYDKQGNEVYSLTNQGRGAFSSQVTALSTVGLGISGGEGWTVRDFHNIYTSTNGSLKSILALHKQIAPLVKDEAAAAHEEAVYKSQFDTALADELDNLKVTQGQWDYLRSLPENQQVSDEDLLIYVRFKAKGKDLKETFDDWAAQDFKIDSENRFNLQNQIAEIFSVEDSEAAELFKEDGIENILKPLFSGTEEEAKEAWETIQNYFDRQQLSATIDTINMSGDQPELAKFLQSLLDEWNEFPGLDWSEKVNTDEFQAQLIKLVNSGATTVEQLKQIFGTDFGIELKPVYTTVRVPDEGALNYLYDIDGDIKQAGRKGIKTKQILTGFATKVTNNGTVDWDGTFDTDNNNKNTKEKSLYETKNNDASLRYKSTESEIEVLTEKAEELRKKLDLTWGPDSDEDLIRYNDLLEQIITSYEKIKEEAETAFSADTKEIESVKSQIESILGGSIGELKISELGWENEQEIRNQINNLMNIHFAGMESDATKDVDKLIDRLLELAQSATEAQQKIKSVGKEVEELGKTQAMWDKHDKIMDKYNTTLRLTNAKTNDLKRTTEQFNRDLSRLEKNISNAWGKDKLAAEDEYIKKLDEQKDLLNEENKLAKERRSIAVAAAKEILAQWDLDIKLYDEEHDRLMTEQEIVKAIQEQWLALYGQTLAAEDLEKILKSITDLYSTIANETSSILDNQEKMDDIDLTKQAKIYEQLVERLNYQLKITQNELTLIAYDFKTLSSNLWTMGEAAALFTDQGEEYIKLLETYEQFYNDIKGADITQKDLAEGMQTAFDGIMQNLDSIEQLDQAVKAYYGQTLQAATTELQLHTAGVTRAITTLNHYLTVLKMIGRETDYDSLGKVYEGLIKVSKNDYDIAKQWYEQTKAQVESLETAMNQYDKESKAYEILHQAWADASNAMDQAYSDMLSKMEAWTQAIVDNFENTLQKLHKALEENLTSGTNFDSLIDHLERLKTAEDEYLTKTNQIYELNKLAREAQKEMDNMTNTVSKQRLSTFIQETNALKDNTKLSNLELEIQRAKYELLLAEMGLEDARATKSKVRLQRDSEGGYGYVYTSDADELADAQQKYEDAQNRLYNIGLENTETYTDKFYQTLREYYQKMIDLDEQYRTDQTMSEEAYREAQAELMEYYNQRLLNYKELYRIAAKETDDRVLEDSWTSQTQMLNNTDYWSAEMSNYAQIVRVEFEQYKKDLTYANEEVGRTSLETAAKVGEIVTESQNLTDEIRNDLLPELNTVLTEVAKQIQAYAGWRDSIEPLIQHYRDLAEAINNAMAAMAGLSDISSTPVEIDNTDWSREMAAIALEMIELEQQGKKDSEEYKQKQKEYEQAKKNREAKIAADPDKYKDEFTTEEIDYLIQQAIGMGELVTLENIVHKGGQFRKQFANYYNYSRKGIASGSTGMYTGEWGTEGKLAILHEKELVLNKEDTDNILSAVGMVRQMSSLLEGFSFGAGLTSPSLAQAVTIHAEFPNVQDHNEIEMALNNLVNRASQYVMV